MSNPTSTLGNVPSRVPSSRGGKRAGEDGVIKHDSSMKAYNEEGG